MLKGPTSPLFTLRGHSVGATALSYCNVDNKAVLISGDEEGSLILWDLTIFRRLVTITKTCLSRIQSLRVIRLTINQDNHSILVAQSRNNGIYLFDLDYICQNLSSSEIKSIATIPCYESLFSRGDAITLEDIDRAVLAYPSCLESNLVTIRFLGPNAQTIVSGTARRYESESSNKCSVFDIILKDDYDHTRQLAFIGYEDGWICVYSFHQHSTETVPVLNSTGLKVNLIKKIDLNFKDFVSGFDIIYHPASSEISMICGSPLHRVVFLDCNLNSESYLQMNEIIHKKQGVSAITISPDSNLVAVACWDSTIKLYSVNLRKHLLTLEHHFKQVQGLLFIDRSNIPEFDQSDANFLLCCSSMEGSISISSIDGFTTTISGAGKCV